MEWGDELVFHKAERYTVTTVLEGWELLTRLGLEKMEENPNKGIKQQLELSPTQAKNSKIPEKA